MNTTWFHVTKDMAQCSNVVQYAIDLQHMMCCNKLLEVLSTLFKNTVCPFVCRVCGKT